VVSERVCLRNAGSEATSVALSTLDVVDIDFACTGNEVGDDLSCGGDATGELSSALTPTAVPTVRRCRSGRYEARCAGTSRYWAPHCAH
jgi:hypothetical protein